MKTLYEIKAELEKEILELKRAIENVKFNGKLSVHEKISLFVFFPYILVGLEAKLKTLEEIKKEIEDRIKKNIGLAGNFGYTERDENIINQELKSLLGEE